jgi:hypothetical protein
VTRDGFDLGDYNEVADRLREFRGKYPDGRLRPVDPTRPFTFAEVNGRTFVVYVAACYRTPDDPLPGIGSAWEPVPGLTPYTRDSELQNAETSAWGRAIVAALIADTKKVASADEVRARTASRRADLPPKSAVRIRDLKVRAAHLQAWNVDVAALRAAAQLPTIARSSVAQLDAWERLITEQESALTAPFGPAGDTAKASGEVVDVVSSALTGGLPPCEQDSDVTPSSDSSSDSSSRSPSSDSPAARPMTTTEPASG